MTKRRFKSDNQELKSSTRKMRNHSTVAEIILWNQLKGQNVFGYDFYRQKSVEGEIVDFFCPELMLAIEIDGITLAGEEKDDKLRQEKYESLGIKILRIQDSNLISNITGVLEAIADWIDRHPPPPKPSKNE